jgi:hypothetical protein
MGAVILGVRQPLLWDGGRSRLDPSTLGLGEGLLYRREVVSDPFCPNC